jgi:hypothetical protein
MINNFRQYKNPVYQPGMVEQVDFASMSKAAYPDLAAQIDKTTQLYQQLAITEAKYITLQQQVEKAKELLDDARKNQHEKEINWLNLMHTHLTLIVSKYYETRILPLKTQLWGLQMEFNGIMNARH